MYEIVKTLKMTKTNAEWWQSPKYLKKSKIKVLFIMDGSFDLIKLQKDLQTVSYCLEVDTRIALVKISAFIAVNRSPYTFFINSTYEVFPIFLMNTK